MSDTARIRRVEAIGRRQKKGRRRTPEDVGAAIPGQRKPRTKASEPTEQQHLARRRQKVAAQRKKDIAQKRVAQQKDAAARRKPAGKAPAAQNGARKAHPNPRSEPQKEAGEKRVSRSRKDKSNKRMLAAAALGGALILGIGIWASSRETAEKVDPASAPYTKLSKSIEELERKVQPDEIIRQIDLFLKAHPEGKLAKKAKKKRASTQDWIEMIEDEGGLEYFKQEKELLAYAKDNRLAYSGIFKRLTRMKMEFKKDSPQAKLQKIEKKLRTRFYRDARRVAGQTRKKARALAEADKLAAAIALLDSYPVCFGRTTAAGWLKEYRTELNDQVVDSKNAVARHAYWALVRRISKLRAARQLDQALIECDSYPHEDQHFRKQLASLKQTITTELSELREQRERESRERVARLARARVAGICSQIPGLIENHQYLRARNLLDGALETVNAEDLRTRLLAEKQLVNKTADLMARLRRAFTRGLRIKVLVEPGKAGTLVAMTPSGFTYLPGNGELTFKQVKPDTWSTMLYKADAVHADPIVAARFLYRIKGLGAADRLLARTLKQQPSLKDTIHALLTEQGFELPADFVYYKERWIDGETHKHVLKGQVKVADQWWTRSQLTTYLSGKRTRSAAQQDPNSRRNLSRRRAKQLYDMGVHQVRTIANHGPANRRVDITIVSSGFTLKEMPNFRTTCQQITDSLARLDPWGYYFNYLNIHSVEIADTQKADPFGANLHKMRVPLSGYGGKSTYSIWRANSSTAWQYAKLAPGADFVIVVANVSTGSASGDIFNKVATIHRQGSNRWDDETGRRIGPHVGNQGEPGGDVATALAHVLGHAVGRLADEYEYSPTGAMAGFQSAGEDDFTVNISRESDVRRTPWHYWVEQPIHAPGAVKSREGAANSETDWYRAQSNCVMRGTSNRYCVVCREQMERTLLKYIRLIEDALPAPTGTTLWRDDSQTFEVRVFQPVNHERERHSRVAVEWFLDGQRIDTHKQSPGSIFSVQLRGDKLAVGTHELIARTRLISPYLRRDMGRSTDCVAWTLNVTGLRRPELRAPHKINANEREFIRFKVETAHLPEAFDLVGEGMPEGASFDPETRIFSWRPSPSQTGIYPIGFSATNGQYTVRKHVELTVRGRSENYGPVCDHVPSVQTQAGTLVRIQLKATDLNGDQLRYRFLKAPNQKLGLRLDQTTGEISWLVPHHLEGAVELAWEASDGRKSSRGKVLIIIDQGHLTPASEFPGHEIGLGLWSNSSEIRSAVLSHLDNQPLSLQVLALTRLLRDVNGQIRTQAADQLQRLLASTKQKEAVLAAGLFLGAERENLHQHCVTPGAWSRVSSLLTLLSEKQDLSSGLRKQATQMKAQLEQIRDEHAGF